MNSISSFRDLGSLRTDNAIFQGVCKTPQETVPEQHDMVSFGQENIGLVVQVPNFSDLRSTDESTNLDTASKAVDDKVQSNKLSDANGNMGNCRVQVSELGTIAMFEDIQEASDVQTVAGTFEDNAIQRTNTLAMFTLNDISTIINDGFVVMD